MKKVILLAIVLIIFQACVSTQCSTKPTKRSGWIVNR